MSKKIKKPLIQQLVERAARAFVAAASAAAAAGLASSDLSMPSLKAVAIGAGAAGVSAVMTIASQFFGSNPESGSFLQ